MRSGPKAMAWLPAAHPGEGDDGDRGRAAVADRAESRGDGARRPRRTCGPRPTCCASPCVLMGGNAELVEPMRLGSLDARAAPRGARRRSSGLPLEQRRRGHGAPPPAVEARRRAAASVRARDAAAERGARVRGRARHERSTTVELRRRAARARGAAAVRVRRGRSSCKPIAWAGPDRGRAARRQSALGARAARRIGPASCCAAPITSCASRRRASSTRCRRSSRRSSSPRSKGAPGDAAHAREPHRAARAPWPRRVFFPEGRGAARVGRRRITRAPLRGDAIARDRRRDPRAQLVARAERGGSFRAR